MTRTVSADGLTPRRSRLPLVVGASLAIHVGLAVFLTQVPAGQRIAARIIPVELVQRKKTSPPRPRRPPPPPRPSAASPVKNAVAPRPQAASPADAAGAEGFGLAPDAGGAGTMEVPIGRTLELPATAGAPAAPATPEPLVLSFEDDSPGTMLEREPEPIGPLRAIYPEIPRLAGATGSALVEAFVDAGGLVVRAALLASSAPAFGKAALDAVRQTRFRPALRSGMAVARSIRIPVRFDLAGSTSASVPPPMASAQSATVSVPLPAVVVSASQLSTASAALTSTVLASPIATVSASLPASASAAPATASTAPPAAVSAFPPASMSASPLASSSSEGRDP